MRIGNDTNVCTVAMGVDYFTSIISTNIPSGRLMKHNVKKFSLLAKVYREAHLHKMRKYKSL